MKLLAFAITLVAAGGGAVLAGRSSDTFLVAMLVTGAWFAVLAAIALLVTRSRRGLLVPVGGALAVVAVAMTVFVGLPTLIGNTVDEALATGERAATGQFVAIAHSAEGRAAVVEVADGSRKLTFSGFETDPGPDLRVYLATGDPAEGELGEFVDLGGLKGNRGDQQYDVPASVDLERYGVVVVWCRAFSVPFTSAPLAT
jgi:hypothetical protein